jgi:predicted transcriptional regulator
MRMDVNDIFRRKLEQIMAEKGMKAPEVARLARLNRRMVYDIIEGRSQSPKIETVFKIADALSVHPGELLGFGAGVALHPRLAELLKQYPIDDQERLALALAQLRPPEVSER